MLDLLASGELSEGHGRAILQVPATTPAARSPARPRRAIGRFARPSAGRKEADGPKPAPSSSPHPDQAAALASAEEALESALGTGVRVRPGRRGIRVELHFDDLDELLAFAQERGSAG